MIKIYLVLHNYLRKDGRAENTMLNSGFRLLERVDVLRKHMILTITFV